MRKGQFECYFFRKFTITTVVFVLLPHIGMGIVAVIEVVKCGLQDFILDDCGKYSDAIWRQK